MTRKNFSPQFSNYKFWVYPIFRNVSKFDTFCKLTKPEVVISTNIFFSVESKLLNFRKKFDLSFPENLTQN